MKKATVCKKNRIKRSISERITLGVCLVLFILYAITLLFPFLWLFYNSLKLNGYEEFLCDPWGLPKQPFAGFVNYSKILKISWSGYTLFDMLLNTLEYVAVLTAIGVFVPMGTAYVVAKYHFKLQKVYFAVAVMTVSVPVVGGLSSMIILLTKLQLYGSYFGIYIMAASGFGGSFLLFYSYFSGVPWSYAEAAFIDGAGHFRVLVFIYLPMALPIMLTVAVLTFLGSWNDYFNVYMYARTRPTLAVGIQFLGDTLMTKNRHPELFAFMIVSMIPGLVLFAVFQKTIMGNVSIGGLKG